MNAQIIADTKNALHASKRIGLNTAPARVALLGTGAVGNALLTRLASEQQSSFAEQFRLAYIANSRHALALGNETLSSPATRALQRRLEHEAMTSHLDDVHAVLGMHGVRIIIDATASDLIADHHATWLAEGIHVVTACKLGQGTSLARWHAIREAQQATGAKYGDSATVGAGLPLLRSIRALRAGGDRIHAIEGVLSGSLAWIFNQYDGARPFSDYVRDARAAGYTEPDPRDDLSGEDVRRKLLILARAAGSALDVDAVTVASLLTPTLAASTDAAMDTALSSLDHTLADGLAAAKKRGETLHYIARLSNGTARIGLEMLPVDHPMTCGAGTDNRVAIWSDRYREQPLIIQGPGAGAQITAAALLDDVLQITRDV